MNTLLNLTVGEIWAYAWVALLGLLCVVAMWGALFYYLRYRRTILRILRIIPWVGVVCLGYYAFFCDPEKEIIIEHVPVQVPQNKAQEFADALAELPTQFGVPDILLDVFLDKESHDRDFSAVKFEPHLIPVAAKFTKNPEKQRALAASYCPFQVLGIEAAQRGVEWAELLNSPRVCVELALTVISNKREKCIKDNIKKPLDTYGLIKCTARGYNGGGERAEAYSVDFMERLSRKLYEKNIKF